MNLKTLSDQNLLSQSKDLVRQERELMTQVLHHLHEIESRRLFSALSRKSLFEYCIKDLNSSADQAARRISAMRLLKDLPEIEEKIEDGSLNLTNLGLAQNLFKKEPKMSKEEKAEVLIQIENKSTREAETIITQHSSEPAELKPDRKRTITPEHVEIRFTAKKSLVAKLDSAQRVTCALSSLL